MGRLVKNREIDNGALTVKIPNITTDQRPAGINGDIIYNTTTGTLQTYAGAEWFNVSSAASEKTITVDNFQGDGTTTVFGNGSGNMDDSSAAVLSFSVTDPTDILVFIGGVYQIPTVNYTVGGNTITFGSAPSGNDGLSNDHIITIIHGLNKLGE